MGGLIYVRVRQSMSLTKNIDRMLGSRFETPRRALPNDRRMDMAQTTTAPWQRRTFAALIRQHAQNLAGPHVGPGHLRARPEIP